MVGCEIVVRVSPVSRRETKYGMHQKNKLPMRLVETRVSSSNFPTIPAVSAIIPVERLRSPPLGWHDCLEAIDKLYAPPPLSVSPIHRTQSTKCRKNFTVVSCSQQHTTQSAFRRRGVNLGPDRCDKHLSQTQVPHTRVKHNQSERTHVDTWHKRRTVSMNRECRTSWAIENEL